MHTRNYKIAGKPLSPESKVLVMVHGRGAGAEDILGLAPHLQVSDFTLIAPEATGNTWYPHSFLAPREQNEPYLGSALEQLKDLVSELNSEGISNDRIYFLGFSQGACLTLEFTAANAQRYGGIAALTGGLIGSSIDLKNYSGNFNGTPVFIGTSDPDPHVPVQRATASAKHLEEMGADVTFKIYPNMGHTVSADEISTVNRIIFQKQ